MNPYQQLYSLSSQLIDILYSKFRAKTQWFKTYTLRESFIVWKVQRYAKYLNFTITKDYEYSNKNKKISDSKYLEMITYLTKIKNNTKIKANISQYSEYILSELTLFFKDNQIRMDRKIKLKKIMKSK